MGLIKRDLTIKELEARRRNARKSTGPRTAKGKARGSLNALKHAQRSQSMLTFLGLFGIRPYALFHLCRDFRAPGETMEPIQLHFFRRWLYAERHRLTGRKRDWALKKKADLWREMNPKIGLTTIADLVSLLSEIAPAKPGPKSSERLTLREAAERRTKRVCLLGLSDCGIEGLTE